jgi:cytidylate kinase
MAILTIARQFGSGAEEIGQALAETMGYQYVDRKTILEDMQREGVEWEKRARYFDENYPSVWERFDWPYRAFVALNQKHILHHALAGKTVIMGRGANFLLRGVKTHLGIRIEAPLEARIERVENKEGINGENARMLVEKADQEMDGAVYLLYGRRWNDPREYDLFFDTAKQPTEELVRAVTAALEGKDRLDPEESRAVLALRARAAEVKAGIVLEPHVYVSRLEVKPKEEGMPRYGLVLRAIVHERDDLDQVRALAQSLAGDLPIDCDVRYRYQSRFGFTKHT